ncbi:MAG: PBSX family phage terminase large subunit [Oscillospiraceae bacterium]|nr:PBSX family phage terminase large subunit [Oscillospiraceae bacterium]
MAVSEKSLENLKKGRPFTKETAAEAGRRGKKRSDEVKKKRKDMGQMLSVIASGDITDKEVKDRLAALGFDREDMQNEALVAEALYQKAMSGNVRAIEAWAELRGQAKDAAEDAETAGKQALSLVWMYYVKNINSGFGRITVCALNHQYTHYEASGGRGSGKSTWASLTVIRLLMENPDVHALVMRKVANTLRDSVYAQYLWSIDALGVSDFWEAKKSPLELVYKPTGQKILFRGADDPMKIKSIKTEFGYIGITHFEEKDQFSGRSEIDTILQSTMRGGTEFWNFETYNPPRSKDNWANKDSLEERSNRVQHKSTYLDLDHPEWLGEAFMEEAESLKQRDEGRYQHEYLGVPVGTGGSVFENLELREITEEEMKRFDRIYQGVDWGWFPDCYAFIRLHYDSNREIIYLLDEHVGNKLTNEQSARWILEHGYNDVPTTCDSAEPKSVADYRSLGVNAKEAVKGPSSVEYGMKWLQRRTIVIDRKRTPHACEEFCAYEYEQTRSGEWISGYPDKNNHTIDAVRYALERIANKYRSQA